MEKSQDIVPITLESDNNKKSGYSNDSRNSFKPKVAIQVKRNNMDITIYNGCNQYILNAALGVIHSHAD